jgi:hypothetical protein
MSSSRQKLPPMTLIPLTGAALPPAPTAPRSPATLHTPVTQRDVETEIASCVGGVMSPLLANIALSALDDHFAGQRQQLMKTSWQRRERRNRGLGNWKMIRFADDLVVMLAGERQHAEALREEKIVGATWRFLG